MGIYQSNTFSMQLVSRYEMNDLFMIRNGRARQGRQHAQYFIPVLEIAACELARYERVTRNLTLTQECRQFLVPFAEVIDPNRSIGENHTPSSARLRLTGLRFLSVPPRAANRRALSREIKASRPSRTREVFSFTPVSLAALRKRPSSMFSVVLICISMHVLCISVKDKCESTACVPIPSTLPCTFLPIPISFHPGFPFTRRRISAMFVTKYATTLS